MTNRKWKMEDDQNGRQPKWKMTKLEDDQNGRLQMEDQHGRQPTWNTTKN